MKLDLNSTEQEGRLEGVRKNGIRYSVREHRMNFFMPDVWLKFFESLNSNRARMTADVLIQTGARINEVRHIENRDVDYDRNTLTLRVTKTKARKGERKGKPRTIPISAQFSRRLKRYLKDKAGVIGLLSTSAFNICLKKHLKDLGISNYYMYSVHNIRKTHGNWLKIMGNQKFMDVDASEICLRLGHDYNTFLKDYGSSSVFDSKDCIAVRNILGSLYSERR